MILQLEEYNYYKVKKLQQRAAVSHTQTQPCTFFETVTQVVQPTITRTGIATND